MATVHCGESRFAVVLLFKTGRDGLPPCCPTHKKRAVLLQRDERSKRNPHPTAPGMRVFCCLVRSRLVGCANASEEQPNKGRRAVALAVR